jgi:hypothetical protein
MFQVGQIVVAKHRDTAASFSEDYITGGKEYLVCFVRQGNIQITCNNGVARMFPQNWFEEIKKVGCDKMKHDHVSVGQFVIGSLHPENGWSMRPEPKTHQTEKQAKKECERLAKLDPTKKFVYLEIKGACQVIGVTWE